MSPTTRAILVALYAALAAALQLPLSMPLRRQLNSARVALARELDIPADL